MRITFLLIGVLTAVQSMAQCDLETFERFRQTGGEFKFLKQYSVSIREMGGAPFAVQYSYVLTKRSTYSFYIKQTDGPEIPVAFILTNGREEVLNYDTLENFGSNGVVLGYTPDVTGIYYLNLYSPRPKKGCINLQLSFTRSGDEHSGGQLPGKTIKSSNAPVIDGERELKQFTIASNSTSRYAMALSGGQLYGLHLSDKRIADKFSIKVSSYSGKEVKGKVTARGNGNMFLFRTQETDLHYLTFSNKATFGTASIKLIELFPE